MNMRRIRPEIGSARAALRAAAVLFLLVSFAANAASAYEREETFQKSLPLQGAKRIVVTNSRGDVKVIGEKGRSDIFCEYTKSIRGRDQDEADRLFNLMDIEVAREGSDITISVRYPDRSGRDRSILAMLVRHYAGLSVDLNIAVPPGIGVEVVSASGDVELASILGAAMITSASGDVEAVGVGDLKVDVSSGDMTVSEVSGKAVLSSSSGSIEAHEDQGKPERSKLLGRDHSLGSRRRSLRRDGVGGRGGRWREERRLQRDERIGALLRRAGRGYGDRRERRHRSGCDARVDREL